MLLTPSPLSQTVTPSRTPSPSSVTYFMDGPKGVFKYFPGFSGAGEVSDKKYYFGAEELFKYTSPAPEKPGKYLKTSFRRRRSIYTHFSGAGEVLIYTYLAPEKPEKYLYTSCLK